MADESMTDGGGDFETDSPPRKVWLSSTPSTTSILHLWPESSLGLRDLAVYSLLDGAEDGSIKGGKSVGSAAIIEGSSRPDIIGLMFSACSPRGLSQVPLSVYVSRA